MKKIFLIIFTIIVVSLIGCFGCNTGGKNQKSIVSNGIELTIETGEHWNEEMKLFLISVKNPPQFAAWIEDDQGNYISTITATEKSVKKNWKSAPKDGRPEALPVWNQRRQNNSEVDTVSSSTPKKSMDIQADNNSLINGQEYIIFLEVNHSFDYNEYWTKENAGVNGQPSLIYSAKFIAGTSGKIQLTPIGHGSIDGSNGDIIYELDTFSTALTIIKTVTVTISNPTVSG